MDLGDWLRQRFRDGVLDLTDLPLSLHTPVHLKTFMDDAERQTHQRVTRLRLTRRCVETLAGPALFPERPDRLFDQLFGVPIDRVEDSRSPRQLQVAWEVGDRTRQIEAELARERRRACEDVGHLWSLGSRKCVNCDIHYDEVGDLRAVVRDDEVRQERHVP